MVDDNDGSRSFSIKPRSLTYSLHPQIDICVVKSNLEIGRVLICRFFFVGTRWSPCTQKRDVLCRLVKVRERQGIVGFNGGLRDPSSTRCPAPRRLDETAGDHWLKTSSKFPLSFGICQEEFYPSPSWVVLDETRVPPPSLLSEDPSYSEVTTIFFLPPFNPFVFPR